MDSAHGAFSYHLWAEFTWDLTKAAVFRSGVKLKQFINIFGRQIHFVMCKGMFDSNSSSSCCFFNCLFMVDSVDFVH